MYGFCLSDCQGLMVKYLPAGSDLPGWQNTINCKNLDSEAAIKIM
jgi:hypothetical protein